MIVQCAICKKDFDFPYYLFDPSPYIKYCCGDCVEKKNYDKEKIKKSVMNEVNT